uniref:Uncharacterized protein n=1 Tax=Tetranychus urticae TaxID=32264 RepID=T1JUP0_TETUR
MIGYIEDDFETDGLYPMESK